MRRLLTIARKKSEDIINKDIDAYRRIRRHGVQPMATKGAAELEQRANSKWEIETGQNLNGNAKLGDQCSEAHEAFVKGELV